MPHSDFTIYYKKQGVLPVKDFRVVSSNTKGEHKMIPNRVCIVLNIINFVLFRSNIFLFD